MFGTHPKGGRGARRFSAPSHSDSRSVLTPKQWDSLETCSGICHNPAPRRGKHKFTQLLVYTHPDLSPCLSPTSASATTQEIVCPTPIRAKKKVRLRLDFFLHSINVSRSLICGKRACCKCQKTNIPSVRHDRSKLTCPSKTNLSRLL